MNGDDNEPITRPSSTRPSMSIYSGVQPFSNPFTKAHDSAKPNGLSERRGNPTESIFKRVLRPQETAFQTPQRKRRPFQTPSRDKPSSLSPYINLLNLPKKSSTPVPQFRSHDFQPSSSPQEQPSSSPAQEQLADEGNPSQDREQPVEIKDSSTGDTEIEELKEAHKTVSEQNRQIETLRYQLITLKNGRKSMAHEQAAMSQELETTRTKMGEITARASSLQSQLQRSDVALNAKTQELGKAGDTLKLQAEDSLQLSKKLEQVSRELEEVKAAYSQEVAKNEDLNVRISDSNIRVQGLVKRYAELEKGLKDLGDSQVTYHRATKVAARDIAEIRKLSSEALAGLNNEKCAQLLDDAKCTVVQLKDELAESQRVNDLFRDKLHITTAQLAEITGRVRELEGEKREVWDRTLQSVSQNAQFQEALSVTEMRAAELATKLRNAEEQGVAKLAQSAKLEAKMDQINERNKELNTEVVALRPLQQEKLQMQNEIADLARRLAEETASRTKLQSRAIEAKDALISAEKELFMLKNQLQDAINWKSEISSNLSTLKTAYKELEVKHSNIQDASRAREKELQTQYDDQVSSVGDDLRRCEQELAALQSNYRLSESQRDQLRSTLSQEQGATTRLREELKETSVRELIVVGKLDMQESRIANLTKEVESKEEMLRQLNAKGGSTQERCEALNITLRLTKEELGNMHDKLENVRATNEATLSALRADLAVLEEQKTTLSKTVEKMSRDANSQEEVLLKRTNDLETVIQGLQKEIRQVNDTKGEIEVGLKREMASSEERENVLKMKVAELQGLIDQMTVSTQNEIATSLKLHKKAILELEDRITVLMKEKDEIAERQRSFPERYRAGTLSDIEKDLVSMLVEDARDLHEQAAVAKDNEIKRRDVTISALHARITELESLLTQGFHPGGPLPDASTILNVKISPVAAGLLEPELLPRNTVSIQPLDTVIAAYPTEVISQSRDLDGLVPLASQMPSELSTPPQSPRHSRAKGTAVMSFVHLSREESETEYIPPKHIASKHASASVRHEPQLPKKRLRTVTTKRVNQEDNKENKAPEPTGRGRQKRRKVTT